MLNFKLKKSRFCIHKRFDEKKTSDNLILVLKKVKMQKKVNVEKLFAINGRIFLNSLINTPTI